MFIEKIKSEGLAHLSCLAGDGETAAVIDPRHDSDIYVEMTCCPHSPDGCSIPGEMPF